MTSRIGVRPTVSVRPGAGAVENEGDAVLGGDRADPGEDVGLAAGGHAAAGDEAVEARLAERGEAGLDLVRRRCAGPLGMKRYSSPVERS